MSPKNKRDLSPQQKQELLTTLENRFNANKSRHADLEWKQVLQKLNSNDQKLWSLLQMEELGGEPDVVGYDAKTDSIMFFDCSAESPKERRSICYDHEALEARKENKPANSAVQMSLDIGVELLTEDQYRMLQTLGNFDTKTSSWVLTPAAIRKRGGAIFCDRRYDHVFVYHNGAESYYAARGFRACLYL
ncbi:MAG: DUF4256 domain-containing protein [Bacteroidia bacterium]|nr:DUF4256 domain-containing protein [Bacteroidia bacterium]